MEPGRGDAIATRVENIALAVKTADCLPVLIADPVKNVVAAVHSGWRGTLSRILPCAIREMQRAFGSDPSQLLTAIGPGIRACCYEVGSDVANFFRNEFPGCCSANLNEERPQKYFLDLGKVLETQMNRAGIRPENRYDLKSAPAATRRSSFLTARKDPPPAACCPSSALPRTHWRGRGVNGWRSRGAEEAYPQPSRFFAQPLNHLIPQPLCPFFCLCRPACRMRRRYLLLAGGGCWR